MSAPDLRVETVVLNAWHGVARSSRTCQTNIRHQGSEHRSENKEGGGAM